MIKSKLIHVVGMSVAAVVFSLAASLLTMFCMDRFLGIDVPIFSAFGYEEETEVETGLQYDGYQGVVELPDGYDWEDLEGFIEIPEEYEDQMWPTVQNGFIGEPDDLPFGETIFSVRATTSGIIYLKNANYGNYNGQGWNAAKEYTEFMHGKYSAAYLTGSVMHENGFLTDTLVVTSYVDRYATPYYLSVVGENGHIQSSDVYSNGHVDYGYVLSYYSDVDWHDLKPVRDPDLVEYEANYRVHAYEEYTYLDNTTKKHLEKLIEKEGLDQYATTVEIIDAVAKYLTDNFKVNRLYDRNLDNEPNVIMAFLEEYKQGDIQHFASAATLLYRALGVPARYTTGHAVLCLADTETDILVENGHAWTEVYLDGIGWIRIDVLNHEYADPVDPEDKEDDIIGLPEDNDPNEEVFNIMATDNDRIYLKLESKGDYTGHGWMAAPEYDRLLSYKYSATYMPGMIINAAGLRDNRAIITPLNEFAKKNYLVPYYISTAANENNQQIQQSDVYSGGDPRKPYIQTYYSIDDWDYYKNNLVILSEYEAAYREFVYANYLEIDSETEKYLEQFIDEHDLANYADDEIMQQLYAVATAIKASAEYDLNYDRALDGEENVAVAFLRDYKKGICQHYATVGTLVFRALGIPARYTVGYVADTQAGKDVTVKSGNAHAWVEVYIDGFGWKYVEVTGGFDADPLFEITLIPEDTEFIWNGEEQSPLSVTGFEEFEAQGYKLEFSIDGFEAPGNYETCINSDFVIYDANGKNVNHLFIVDISTKGEMKIKKAQVTITPDDIKHMYDGTPKSPTTVTITGFEEFESKEYSIEWTATSAVDPGEHYTFVETYKVLNANGDDVTYAFAIDTSFNGKMTITSPDITLKPADCKYTYDGEMKTPIKTVGFEEYAAIGYRLECEYSSYSGVGRHKTDITSYKIFDPNGNDVTDTGLINVALEQGKMTVFPPEDTVINMKWPESHKPGAKLTEEDNYVIDGKTIKLLWIDDKQSIDSEVVVNGFKEFYDQFIFEQTTTEETILGTYDCKINGYRILQSVGEGEEAALVVVEEYGYSEEHECYGYTIYDNGEVTFFEDYDSARSSLLFYVDYSDYDNYSGSMEIYLEDFTLTPAELSYTWSGVEKEIDNEKVTGFDLYRKHGFTVEVEGTTCTNIGRYKTKIDSYKILSPAGDDVTEYINANVDVDIEKEGRTVIVPPTEGKITIQPLYTNQEVQWNGEEKTIGYNFAGGTSEKANYKFSDHFTISIETTKKKAMGEHKVFIESYVISYKNIFDAEGKPLVAEMYSREIGGCVMYYADGTAVVSNDSNLVKKSLFNIDLSKYDDKCTLNIYYPLNITDLGGSLEVEYLGSSQYYASSDLTSDGEEITTDRAVALKSAEDAIERAKANKTLQPLNGMDITPIINDNAILPGWHNAYSLKVMFDSDGDGVKENCTRFIEWTGACRKIHVNSIPITITLNSFSFRKSDNPPKYVDLAIYDKESGNFVITSDMGSMLLSDATYATYSRDLLDGHTITSATAIETSFAPSETGNHKYTVNTAGIYVFDENNENVSAYYAFTVNDGTVNIVVGKN